MQAANSAALPAQAWAAAGDPRHWSPPPAEPPKPQLTSSDPSKQRASDDPLRSDPAASAQRQHDDSQGSAAHGASQRSVSQHPRTQPGTSQHSGAREADQDRSHTELGSSGRRAGVSQQQKNARGAVQAADHTPCASPAFGSPVAGTERAASASPADDAPGPQFFGTALQASAQAQRLAHVAAHAPVHVQPLEQAQAKRQPAQAHKLQDQMNVDTPHDAAVDASPASTMVFQSMLSLTGTTFARLTTHPVPSESSRLSSHLAIGLCKHVLLVQARLTPRMQRKRMSRLASPRCRKPCGCVRCATSWCLGCSRCVHMRCLCRQRLTRHRIRLTQPERCLCISSHLSVRHGLASVANIASRPGCVHIAGRRYMCEARCVSLHACGLFLSQTRSMCFVASNCLPSLTQGASFRGDALTVCAGAHAVTIYVSLAWLLQSPHATPRYLSPLSEAHVGNVRCDMASCNCA